MQKKDFLTVAISWIVMSFFGALPFVINGDIPSVVDAMFETVSGMVDYAKTDHRYLECDNEKHDRKSIQSS